MDPSLSSLEWPSLLRHYSQHCSSAPAKALALEILPADSQAEAEQKLELTHEALQALEAQLHHGLSGLDVIDPVLERLVRQAVLDGRELLQVAKLSEISSDLRAAFSSERTPHLSVLATSIPGLKSLVSPIRHAIDEDGIVRDSASPTLRSLRDQERKLHSEARERLEAVLQHSFREGHLQDKFFDFRDGRYLIPVKAEFKSKVPGFVVESSATRATVFMEPESVRASNDRIKQTQLLIEEEIYRILQELSSRVHPRAEECVHAYELCIDIDLALGRGSFARQYGSLRGVSRPTFADHFYLDALYHPLLAFVIPPEKIMRNAVLLGPERTVLVISGPNTGGKTVLLKAVGLSSLMARSGFFLPSAGEARLPFFGHVLAQIGDAQNLELSLSSFSGSVLHLKEMLEAANNQSLVLIDEILHATDPDEATALSRAILLSLQRKGAFAIVTTHLNGLKVSGEEAFESASMEFDPEKLSPTYRLRMGVPGSSRALEIGLKLGLPPAVIDEARSYLSQERLQEQSAVDQLEGRERELQNAREELQSVQHTLEEERERYSTLNAELASHKKRFRSEALEKLRDQQRSALQEVEHLISTYKKKLRSVDEKHSAALEAQADTEKVRARFREIQASLDEIAPPLTPAKPAEEPTLQSFLRQNAPVRVLSLQSDGVLLSDPTASRAKPAEVMVGTMRLRVPWDQLEPKAGAGKITSRGHHHLSAATPDVPAEVNLIGKTVDEASDFLAQFLDRAARSGRPSVRIVHGHGSGALRKAIRELLRSSPYEMKYRPGTAQEGGEGCTVVEFI